MSRSIDERIVSMQFDNKKFEKGVAQSLNTLDVLNEKIDVLARLTLGSAGKISKGLFSIAGGFSETMGSAVKGFFDRFGAIGRFVARKEDEIIGSIERSVKSLSVDQISAGWQKYADKTAAVQTIMAATAKDFDDVGEQMEYVTSQINKLNWFTDETSYNFVDMVSEIGKFTSKGNDLETSVTAMQGIANWAAISGANAQAASHAMYNLSQALGTGAVKLLDWRSVENVNMDTVEFKNIVMETAAALGTLKKEANGTFKTLGDKGEIVDEASFASTLANGWFTSDVLIKALNQYGSFTDALYKATEETGSTATEFLSYIDDYQNGVLNLEKTADDLGITTSELSKYLEDLSSDTYDLGRRAFQAGQEAKTAEDAINSVKDAVSTGWMNTFELIFGNYLEAKKLWTDVANNLWDVFAASGEERNALLKNWRAYKVATEKTYKASYDYSSGTAELVYEAVESLETIDGRDFLVEGLNNAFEALATTLEAVRYAFHSVFPPMTVERLMDLSVKFRDLTEKVRDYLAFSKDLITTGEDGAVSFENLSRPMQLIVKSLRGMFSFGSIVIDVFKDIGNVITSGIGKNPRLLAQLQDIIERIADKLYRWKDSFKQNKVYVAFIKSLNKVWSDLLTYTSKALIKLKDFFGYLNGELSKIGFWDAIENGLIGIFEWFEGVIPGIANLLSSGIQSIKEWIASSGLLENGFSSLSDIFLNLGNYAGIAWEKIKEFFGGLMSYFTGNGDPSEIVSSLANGAGYLGKAIKDLFDIAVSSVKGLFNSGEDEGQLASDIFSPFEAIKKWFEDLKTNFLTLLWPSIEKFFSDSSSKIGGAVSWFFDKLESLLAQFKDFEEKTNFFEVLERIFSSIEQLARIKLFKNLSEVGGVLRGVRKTLNQLAGVVNSLKPKAIKKVDTVGTTLLKFAGAILMLIVGLGALMQMVKDNPKALLTAAEYLGGIALGIMLFFKILSHSGKGKGSAVSDIGKAVLKLAISLGILMAEIYILSKFKQETFVDGLIKLGTILVALWAFVGMVNKVGGFNAKGFIALGVGILIIIRSLKSLIKVNWDDYKDGVIKLGIVMGMLAVLVMVMGATKFNGKDSLQAFIGIAGAILVLAWALKDLSKMDWESIKRGATALGVIMGGLTAVIWAMSKLTSNKIGFGQIAAIILGLVGVAGLMWGFVQMVRQLSNYNADDILKQAEAFGLIVVAIGGITAAMGWLTKKIGFGNMALGSLALILGGLAADLVAVMSVITVEFVGWIDKYCKDNYGTTIEDGIEVFKSTLEAVALFQGAMFVIDIVAGMFATPMALGALATTLATFCSDLDILMTVGVMALVATIDKDLKDNHGTSIEDGVEAFKTTLEAVALFQGAMFAIDIVAGVFAAPMALGALATTLATFCSDLDILMTVGVIALVAIIDKDLKDNHGTSIEDGVAAFTSTLDAVALFQGAMFAIDIVAGVFAAPMALGALATTLATFCSDLDILMTTGVVALVALIDKDLKDNYGTSIANGADVLKTTIDAINYFLGTTDIDTTWEGLDYAGSQLGQLVGTTIGFVGDLVDSLRVAWTSFVVASVTAGWTKDRVENAKTIMTGLGEAIGDFFGAKEGASKGQSLESFSEHLPSFGDNLKTFAKGLEPFDEDLITSAANVGKTFIELENSLNPEGGLAQWFLGEKDIGEFGNRLTQFGEGLKEFGSSLDGSSVENISSVVGAAQSIIDLAHNAEDFSFNGFMDLSFTLSNIANTGFTEFSAIFSDSEGVMKSQGIGLIGMLCEGITEATPDLTLAANASLGTMTSAISNMLSSDSNIVFISGQSIGNALVKGMKDGSSNTYSIGSDAAQGYVNGLKSKLSQVKSIASQIGSVTKSALRNSIDSHSPSRDAYEIASDFVAGYNNSLRDSLPFVAYASQAIGEESVISLQDALHQLQELIDGDMGSEPVITPVFDMSNLDSAVDLMNAGFATSKSIDLTASKAIIKNAQAVSDSQIKMNQNPSQTDVVNAINNLTDRVDYLNNSVTSMRVVLDTGATVGALAPAMDKTLGQRAVYKGRGN